VATAEITQIRAPRTFFLDVMVALLAAVLVAFLLMTMNVRRRDAAVVRECQNRLMALAQAEQAFLIQHGRFADSLPALRPFLEPGQETMPFTCPITGNQLEVVVQGERYVLLAPGTGFSVLTGDPNW
jgi:hypothetical protein